MLFLIGLWLWVQHKDLQRKINLDSHEIPKTASTMARLICKAQFHGSAYGKQRICAVTDAGSLLTSRASSHEFINEWCGHFNYFKIVCTGLRFSSIFNFTTHWWNYVLILVWFVIPIKIELEGVISQSTKHLHLGTIESMWMKSKNKYWETSTQINSLEPINRQRMITILVFAPKMFITIYRVSEGITKQVRWSKWGGAKR